MFFRKIRSPPQTLHAHRRVTDTLWVYDRGALLEQSAGRDEVDESLLRSGTHPAGQLAPLSGCGLKGPAEPGAMRHCPQPRRCRNTLSPSCEIVCRGLIEVCPISEHCNICPGDDPTPSPALPMRQCLPAGCRNPVSSGWRALSESVDYWPMATLILRHTQRQSQATCRLRTSVGGRYPLLEGRMP